MRLVGLSPADYSIDRLPTVFIKSIPPPFIFTVKKYARVMRVLTVENGNYRLQLSLLLCT